MHPHARSDAADVPALTGLRGYAALWVLLSHLSYTDSFSAALPARLHWGYVDGILRHEYLAVDLFFVLSGFLLTHVHAHEFDTSVDRRSYVRFLALRLARVYPLHVLALALAWWVRHDPPIVENSNLAMLLHLLLMSSWGFLPNLSWNDPAWSLSAEWLAYLTLPVMITLSAGLTRGKSQLLALVAILGFCWLFFFAFIHLPTFYMPLNIGTGIGADARVLIGVAFGSVLRRVYDRPAVRRLPWAALFWLGLPLVLATMTDLHGLRRNNSLAAYLSVLFVMFAAASARPSWFMWPLSGRFPRFLGKISFAIYIFHYPTLLGLKKLLSRTQEAYIEGSSPWQARLVALLVVLFMIGVGAAAHYLVEEPFRRWARPQIMKRWPRVV